MPYLVAENYNVTAAESIHPLVEGEEYAGLLGADTFAAPPRRPVKVRLTAGGRVLAEDPDFPEDPVSFSFGTPFRLQVVGRWNGLISGLDVTWQQAAEQQFREVRMQRDLAERLTAYGIPREPEAYLPHRNFSNAVSRSLTLTYDELNRLLTDAGYPPVSSVFRD
jgi:hypothetical protein